jgi:erythromycin esterase
MTSLGKTKVARVFRRTMVACSAWAALAAAAQSAAAPPSAPAEVTGWLREHAIPLKTHVPGSGFDDLRPLGQMVGDARVVALGEATHGTHEFFQFKHRMLEYLASEKGFTVFAIEASMPEGFDVNEYVLTGKGDPAGALSGLYFWTWDTEEVLDLIRWMRSWNADPRHVRKLIFYGFDMQFSARAVRETIAYLRRVDPGMAQTAAHELAPLDDAYREKEFGFRTPDSQAAVGAAVARILQAFDTWRGDYEKKSSAADWARARQHAQILAQFVDREMHRDDYAIRDRAMAENIQWILGQEEPDARMVVWAHNGHVQASIEAHGMTPMGVQLRKAFGSQLAVFGFAFNRGAFQAIDASMQPPGSGELQDFTVGPAPAGTLDAALADTGLKLAAVDLRAIPTAGAVAQWFSLPQKSRSVGSMFWVGHEELYYESVPPHRQFDVLLFVETTTAARSNPGGRRPAAATPRTGPVNLDFEASHPWRFSAAAVLAACCAALLLATSRNRTARPVRFRALAGLAMAGLVANLALMLPHGFGPRDYLEGWERGRAVARGFRVSAFPCAGRPGYCAEIAARPAPRYGEMSGQISQTLNTARYRGKRVKLCGWVRTEGDARAYLWLTTPKKIAGELHESMVDRPISDPAWRRYEISGNVPQVAETLSFGLAMTGDGRVFLDDVTLERVDP